MNRRVVKICVIFSGLLLAACQSSGTTYGTGKTHEEATLEGLSSILDLKVKDQAKIDYAARPDLIMPANKNALPAPASDNNNSVQNWPVTPEERIAAVRAAAPGDAQTRDNPNGATLQEQAAFARSQKKGIRKTSTAEDKEAAKRRNFSGVFFGSNPNELAASARNPDAKALREQLTYTPGAGTRRYLTEPPVEYRTPAVTAEAGETGISEEELEERLKIKKAEEEANLRW